MTASLRTTSGSARRLLPLLALLLAIPTGVRAQARAGVEDGPARSSQDAIRAELMGQHARMHEVVPPWSR